MRVRITSIDRSQAVLVGDKTLGYRGEFSCPLVSGTATFIPYTGRDHELVPGALISVETSQEGITNFSVLSERVEPRMTALSEAGAYDIVGTVAQNSEDEVFYIDVGGFFFAVDLEESGGVIPREGDTVKFVLHGLCLWDENI